MFKLKKNKINLRKHIYSIFNLKMSKKTINQNNTEDLIKETLLKLLIQGSNSNSQLDLNRFSRVVLNSSPTSSINTHASSTATSLASSEVDDNFSDSDETNKRPKKRRVMETEKQNW